MTASVVGELEISGSISEDGHREYPVKYLVVSDDLDDGPQVVLEASGLPAVGSTWSFGNDSDSWAFCWPKASATMVVAGEVGYYWIVEKLFSTKPLKRCQDTSIEDPLDEPPKISGSFSTYTREYTRDRYGNAIMNGAFEILTGSVVEFDDTAPSVTISMNLAILPLSTYASYMNKVNDRTLWGLGARKIKLSSVTFERNLYGVCNYYYTVTYTFTVNYNTFDRVVPDAADHYLAPGGNPMDPRDYRTIRDLDGEPVTRLLKSGLPWDGTGSPDFITIEAYDEANLLLLGIPGSF